MGSFKIDDGTIHRNICRKCGATLASNARFCDQCGEKVNNEPEKLLCRKCGNELKAYAKFCPQCGTPVGERPTSNPSTSSPPEVLTFTVNGVSFDMIKVEHGTFQMGSDDSDAYGNEKPVHSVTLTNDYYIGKYQVTQALWKAVMGNNPSHLKGDDLPVESVSWDDIQEFLRKLNSITGKNYRLPTEAEWEYAARGGNKSRGYKHSGSNNINDVAWYWNNSGSQTHTVGTKSPNELGICDMSGNVWEWCQDWYGPYPSGAQTNPTGASSGSYRVRRGGSWLDGAGNASSSSRHHYYPNYRYLSLGFRLAL